MTRKEAKERGLKTYQGKPCKECGDTERYVSNSGCKACNIKRNEWKLYDDKLMEPYRTKEKKRSKLRRWREENFGKYKDIYLKYRFGITGDEYDELYEHQNGKCRICGEECSSGRRLAVDHCHETGIIRGLLCGNCNRALGLFKDNVDMLYNAIEYLKGTEIENRDH